MYFALQVSDLFSWDNNNYFIHDSQAYVEVHSEGSMSCLESLVDSSDHWAYSVTRCKESAMYLTGSLKPKLFVLLLVILCEIIFPICHGDQSYHDRD